MTDNLISKVYDLEESKSFSKIAARLQYGINRIDAYEKYVPIIEEDHISKLNDLFKKSFLSIPKYIVDNLPDNREGAIENLILFDIFTKDCFEQNYPAFESNAKYLISQIKKNKANNWLFWNKIQSSDSLTKFPKINRYAKIKYIEIEDEFMNESTYLDKITKNDISSLTKKGIVKYVDELTKRHINNL